MTWRVFWLRITLRACSRCKGTGQMEWFEYVFQEPTPIEPGKTLRWIQREPHTARCKFCAGSGDAYG